jgi:hypothetical protein
VQKSGPWVASVWHPNLRYQTLSCSVMNSNFSLIVANSSGSGTL